jgi:hypothetical protein
MYQNTNFNTKHMALVLVVFVLLFACQPIARALGY